MEEALYRAKNGEARSLDITLLHMPPIVMGDVVVKPTASSEGAKP
jgi:hypothetical protein